MNSQMQSQFRSDVKNTLNAVMQRRTGADITDLFVRSGEINKATSSMSQFINHADKLAGKIEVLNDTRMNELFNDMYERGFDVWEQLLLLLNSYDKQQSRSADGLCRANHALLAEGFISEDEYTGMVEDLQRLGDLHNKYLRKSRKEYAYLLGLLREKINENKELRRENAELK